MNEGRRNCSLFSLKKSRCLHLTLVLFQERWTRQWKEKIRKRITRGYSEMFLQSFITQKRVFELSTVGLIMSSCSRSIVILIVQQWMSKRCCGSFQFSDQHLYVEAISLEKITNPITAIKYGWEMKNRLYLTVCYCCINLVNKLPGRAH